MTRNDFELIAQWLHNSRPVAGRYEIEHPFEVEQWRKTIEVFADGLKRNNVRFNKAKFIAACENGLG
jgi:hypothetical protein